MDKKGCSDSTDTGQESDHVVVSERDRARSGGDVVFETAESRQHDIQLARLVPLPRLEPGHVRLGREVDLRAGRTAHEIVPVLRQNSVVQFHDLDAQHEREDEFVLLEQTSGTIQEHTQ